MNPKPAESLLGEEEMSRVDLVEKVEVDGDKGIPATIGDVEKPDASPSSEGKGLGLDGVVGSALSTVEVNHLLMTWDSS